MERDTPKNWADAVKHINNLLSCVWTLGNWSYLSTILLSSVHIPASSDWCCQPQTWKWIFLVRRFKSDNTSLQWRWKQLSMAARGTSPLPSNTTSPHKVFSVFSVLINIPTCQRHMRYTCSLSCNLTQGRCRIMMRIRLGLNVTCVPSVSAERAHWSTHRRHLCVHVCVYISVKLS